MSSSQIHTADGQRALPEVDVAVVGAGILGAGVAQAAAAAGRSVALLERRTPAAGTSSRSSKLIHGGLRYLETFQLGLVRESLAERAILLRIAPHLVRLVPFYLPVYAGMRRGPWTMRAGLSLYAALAGFGRNAGFRSVPKVEWPQLDGLTTNGLRAVFEYHDGQTDDAALCRAVVASAASLGAEVHLGAEVVRATRCPRGWRVTWRTGAMGGDVAEHTLDARVVVNAGGPWANRVNDVADGLSEGSASARRDVDLVAGTHIEVAGRLERGIYYTEAPSDGRAVFSIPWKGRVMIGTTETPYAGDPAAIAPTEAEIEYLLAVHRRYFPGSRGEVLDSWAGLRVLPKAASSAFRRPREVVLAEDDAERPTWITLYGGKLTGYRHTAERVAARLERSLAGALGPGTRRADTATLMLPELERVTVWDR
ncbi:MAG: FAD-dependent oxidoreductase [Planctomycetota bacterium]